MQTAIILVYLTSKLKKCTLAQLTGGDYASADSVDRFANLVYNAGVSAMWTGETGRV